MYKRYFLQLPKRDNIAKEPKTPYSYSTSGVLHVNKFTKIIEILQNNNNATNCIASIASILESHQLQLTISQMNLQQITDFLRHVVIINRDSIFTWDQADELNIKLDKVCLPSWKLTKNKFEQNIEWMLNTRVQWEIPESMIPIATEFITNFYKNYKFENFRLAIQETNYWTLQELFNLYAGLIFCETNQTSFQNNEKDPGLLELLDNIERIIFDSIHDDKYIDEENIILSLLFFNYFRVRQDSSLMMTNNLILSIYSKLDQNPFAEDSTYDFIFTSVKTYVIDVNLSNTINIKEEYTALNDLLSSFFPNGASYEELQKFKDRLLAIDPSPNVFTMVTYSLIRLLIRLNIYAEKIPNLSQNIQNVKALITRLINFIRDLLKTYITRRYEITEFNNARTFYQQLQIKVENPVIFLHYISQEICLGPILAQNSRFTDSIEQHKEDKFVIKLAREISENHAQIIKLAIEIPERSYPFQEIYEEILQTLPVSRSLFGNEAFEKNILNTISIINSFILNNNTWFITCTFPLEKLLRQFLIEWLHVFVNDKYLRFESVLLLSPLLENLYARRIQKMYLNQNFEIAYLEWLNYYILQKLIESIIAHDTSEYSTATETKIINLESLSELVYKLKIKDFNFESEILQSIIAYINSKQNAINQQKQIAKTAIHSNILPSTEQLLKEYGILAYKFADFMQYIDDEPEIDYFDWITNAPILEDRAELTANNVFLLGSHSRKMFPNGTFYRFPLIEHTVLFAEAIKLFPMMSNIQLFGS